MTPVEALKLALSKEEEAIDMYKNMIQNHPAIADLLTTLLNEEFKHKKLIEAKILEITK